ncbi:MAG: sugar transferase [Anaerolineales bacterium]|nr:sugar transferase [Anaerolineales bacterium]
MKLSYDAQKEHRWRFRFVERRILLLNGDIFAVILALVVALLIWGSQAEFLGFSLSFILERVPRWFFLMPFIWLFLLLELYDIRKASSWSHTLQSVGTAAVIGSIIYLGVYFSSPPESLPRIGVAAFILASVIFTLLWRLFYIRVLTSDQFLRRVLVVGGGVSGKIFLESLNEIDPKPYFVIGIIDDDPEKQNQEIAGYKVIGSGYQLLDVIQSERISDIIVAISGVINGETFQALLDTQELGVEITRMPVAYENLNQQVPIRILETDWILRSFVDDTGVSGVYNIGKRIMDLLGGMVGVGIFLFLLPGVGLIIFLEDGFPIFYRQERLGKSARPYKIIKFRTMVKNAELDGQAQWASENDQRVTKFGRFLRRTHLDEFPQFINVLKGEMSLVGPRSERPSLIEKLQKDVPFYRARLLVKPGVTGWAQINYGYPETVDETIDKLEYDLYYIKNRTIMLYLRILLGTPATIFGLKGK